MKDKMTPDKERENCPCRKAIINPFDAMMMVVVRRLDESYHELKNCKLSATETEFTLRNAKLCFYRELIKQSIDTEFSPEEIVALYENEELARGAWMIWNTSAVRQIRYSVLLQSSVSTNRYRKRLPIC